jgi:putative methionine-R-sulfoxide reductase with GAF domain
MEFIGIYKKDKIVGVIDLDAVTIGFLDKMFDEGFEFNKISKNDLEHNKNISIFVK